MSEPIYSVSMTADRDTYWYDVYRFADGRLSVSRVSLGALACRKVRFSNNVELLAWVNAHPDEAYSMGEVEWLS